MRKKNSLKFSQLNAMSQNNSFRNNKSDIAIIKDLRKWKTIALNEVLDGITVMI